MNKFRFFIFIFFLPLYFVFAQNETTVSDEIYPGPLAIPINKLGLQGKQLIAESYFSELLQLDLNLLSKIYAEMPSTKNGKILDVDIARKLFPPFNDGHKGASLYSVSTHVPAAQFINYLFTKAIEDLSREKESPQVLFLAGGGGSGKGSIAALIPNIYDNVDLVLDGTLANAGKANKRIEYALNNGFLVTVIYVFRPVELAIPGIVERAIETGRGVPILVAAEDHYDAQKTVLGLFQKFKNRIKIIVISNMGSLKDVKMAEDPEAFLNSEGASYSSKDEVILRAIKAYNDVKTQEISPELKAVLEQGMDQFNLDFIQKRMLESQPVFKTEF